MMDEVSLCCVVFWIFLLFIGLILLILFVILIKEELLDVYKGKRFLLELCIFWILKNYYFFYIDKYV